MFTSTRIIIIALLSGCLWCRTLPAQVARFRHLTTADGLSQSYVYAISQDHYGFMWLGTRDGLNRYDGHTFKKYHADLRDSTTLPDNVVLCIAEDKSGYLWVGTNEKGVGCLDRKRDAFIRYTHSEHNSGSISSNLIQDLCVDSSNTVWVATQSGGVSKFLRGRSAWQRMGAPLSTCFSMYCGSDGTVWCGAGDGLYRLNRRKDVFEWVPFATDDVPVLATGGRITVYGVTADNDGVLWLATGLGLARYDAGSGSIRHVYTGVSAGTSGRPALTVDKRGDLWMASLGGLLHFSRGRPDTPQVILPTAGDPGSIGSHHTFAVLTDRSGRLWVGSENGIDILDERLSWFRTLYPGKNIRTVAELPDKSLWVGTQEGEVYVDGIRFDFLSRAGLQVSRGAPVAGRTLRSFAVNKLFASSRGDVWIGTSTGGIFRYTPASRRIQHFPSVKYDSAAPGDYVAGEGVWAVCEDLNGDVWCGSITVGKTSAGVLTRFHCDEKMHSAHVTGRWYIPFGTMKRFGLWAITQYRGHLLVGTSRGILEFNPDSTPAIVRTYRSAPANSATLEYDNVWVLHHYNDTTMLCGTWGSGLGILHPGGDFTSLTTREGLPNNYVYSVLHQPNGKVWLTTNKGLCRLDLQNQAVANYDASDGLQGNEFNPNAACLRANGQMCFGGPNGVTVFDPSALAYDSGMVTIVVSAFKVFERLRAAELNNGDTIRLSYADNHFSFEFAALDYGNPRKCQYAYQLIGIDSAWILSGTRNNAFYTNIPPGTYTFRIAASNSDGVWNMNGVRITVIISPPLWGQWWFRPAIALLALSAGALYLWRRRQRREQQARTLEQARWGERRVLASEIHDGPLQDLYATRFLLEPGQPQNLDKAGAMLATVRDELRRICGELSMPKFETGLQMALQTLIAHTRDKCPDTTIVFDYAAGEDIMNTTQKEAVYFVVRTALGNIVKHAQASRAHVRVESDSRTTVLTVSDNGRGFQVMSNFRHYAENNSYGLLLTESFAAHCGADLKIVSAPGAGTTVRLYIRKKSSLKSFFLGRKMS